MRTGSGDPPEAPWGAARVLKQKVLYLTSAEFRENRPVTIVVSFPKQLDSRTTNLTS